MSETENKPKVHAISRPGENDVGTNRFSLLRAAADKAAEAFKHGFYLEAITLVESLLATRLESRLAWVREIQGKSLAVRFNTLGPLCTELLGENAAAAPDWHAFYGPIQDIREWAKSRNVALHEMAKLIEEDGRVFSEKYEMCRTIALSGFRAILAYDAVDRNERRKAGKYTATDDMNNGTAFDHLRSLV
ncbi:hypothetical protein WME90_33015 [Sorangium sp. So ce375]|uniref:hypothetical protein n=1 Tax=Sorangium sp. So ce375 TaxID=3133306 RepID=UPI003F5C6E0F